MTADFDFAVMWRQVQDAIAFECVICCRNHKPDPWRHRDSREPICPSCERHWSSVTRLKPTGITRGDHRTLMRLSAISAALNWEIHNGKHTKRSLAFG